MIEFKTGDKVSIKESVIEKYGSDNYYHAMPKIYIHELMDRTQNTLTISDIFSTTYRVEEDPQSFCFPKECFEAVNKENNRVKEIEEDDRINIHDAF